MIKAYPRHPTVEAGATLTLCVSTDARRFRVAIYRHGDDHRSAARWKTRWFAGDRAPARPAEADWEWPGYDISVPAHCPAGVYLAALVEDGPAARGGSAQPGTADDSGGNALFVVRPNGRRVAPVLYKIPLFTYHAYNIADTAYADREAQRRLRLAPPMEGDGQCLYTSAKGASWRRPGGGTGGHPWDSFNPDFYDPTSPRQTFAHWDRPFILWLESAGCELDFCTDLDLHAGSVELNRYALMISAGHDEYWSDAMRLHAERYLVGGGNIAFFGGNTCYFRVAVREDISAIERAGKWTPGAGATRPEVRPENALTGVSYRNGGGKWRGARPPSGYTVQGADHWIYAGTGALNGEVFGAAERLVGYECDGAHFDRETASQACIEPDGTDDTPPNFRILGVGDVTGWPVSDCSGEINGNGAATMGLHENGGTVFTAATVDWPRVVALNSEPIAMRVTRNVVERLSR